MGPRVAFLGFALACAGAATAQTPPEVQGVVFSSATILGWSAVPSTDVIVYDVYRGDLADMRAGIPARCHGYPVGSSRVDLQACKLEYSIVSPK